MIETLLQLDSLLARASARSLPGMSVWPGTHWTVRVLCWWCSWSVSCAMRIAVDCPGPVLREVSRWSAAHCACSSARLRARRT